VTTEVVPAEPVDLSPISAAIHHGCMGLPQELVDHITVMLHDDLRALKACSLTCKAMFASTRHLIHQTLRLTGWNNQSVLTQIEKLSYLRWDHNDVELRFLSYMGERGFLQYTRHVYIRMWRLFTPDILVPHLDHFQSLDRVHSLTIEDYEASMWRNDYKTCFIHFYPTLTSLTLRHPQIFYHHVLRFALQFPNLENLCIEYLEHSEWVPPDFIVPIVADSSPPLRGHLRLVGVDNTVHWPTEFAYELPNGIRFRSVEFEDVFCHQAQRIFVACWNTLESLTIVPRRDGTHRISYSSHRLTSSYRKRLVKILRSHSKRGSPSIDPPCRIPESTPPTTRVGSTFDRLTSHLPRICARIG